MTLKKKLIATAVGSTLTLGLGMQAAQAGHMLMFPYVIKDANRTTLITMIGNGASVSSGATIHLQYYTKDLTAANTAACQPNSSTLTFTDNDIVTFDTGALLGAGPLFGDTTNNAPLGTSISYAAPRHGYLLARGLQGGNDIFHSGFWMELDLANGGAHGDIGYVSNNDDNYNAGPGAAAFAGAATDAERVAILSDSASPANALHVGDVFSPTIGTNGGYDNIPHAVPFWPTSTASTVFTVTPMGIAMDTSENNTSILQVLNSNNVQGAYDRNENGIDGTVRQTVRCVGRLTASQLMPGVVANAAWAATGGWGWLANLGDGDTNYTEGGTADLRAAVYQVDTSTAAGTGKFMMNSTAIATFDY
jgi:hypothetical protein